MVHIRPLIACILSDMNTESCPYCHHENLSSARFCMQCHAELAETAQTPAAPAPQTPAARAPQTLVEPAPAGDQDLYCPHCGGKRADAGALYCSQCGNAIAREAPTRRFEQENAERRYAEAATPGLKGLGGWLVFPIIGLFATLIIQMVFLFVLAPQAMDADLGSELSSSFRSLIVFEIVVNVVIVMASVMLLTMMFLKRRVLPRLIIAFYAFNLLVVVVDSIAALALSDGDASGASVARSIVQTIIACAIWIPYFAVSKRVKNTFVN
jgi:ribosomal protein L37AE/L43A